MSGSDGKSVNKFILQFNEGCYIRLQWTNRSISNQVSDKKRLSGKVVRKAHKLDAPLGVRGRNSNNDLVREKLGWDYSQTLEEGIAKTYAWISEQIKSRQHGVVEITSKELEHAESI